MFQKNGKAGVNFSTHMLWLLHEKFQNIKNNGASHALHYIYVYVCRLVAGKQNHAEMVAGYLRAIECDEA